MNKRIKRKISVLLVVTMIASLFSGTAMAKEAKTNGGLFKGTPEVWISEGNQLEQILEVATPADALLATDSEATVVPELFELVVMDEGLSVSKPETIATPSVATPANAKVTLSADGSSYAGNVTVRYNWFKDGVVGIKQGESLPLEISSWADGVDADVSSTDPKIVNVSNAEGSWKAIVAADANVGKEVEIRATANGKIVGKTYVVVDNGAEKDKIPFFKGKSEFLDVNTTGYFELADEMNAKLDADLASKITLVSSNPDAVEVAEHPVQMETGEWRAQITTKVSGETAKITASYSGSDFVLTKNTIEITVGMNPDTREDFFEEDTMTIVRGSEKELKLVGTMSNAIQAGDAVLTCNPAGAVVLSGRSNEDQTFVHANEVGIATLTIHMGEAWDSCEVRVVSDKKLLELEEDQYDTVVVYLGAKLPEEVMLTQEALDLLAENDGNSEIEVVEKAIVDVSLDMNDEDRLLIEGREVGSTEVFFTIGEYTDFFTVVVNEDPLKILEEILDQIIDIDPDAELTDEQIDIVISAASKMQEIDISQIKEDDDNLEPLMEQVEVLEKLILKANPNLAVSDPEVISSKVKGIIVAGLALSLDPFSENKTEAKLKLEDTTVPRSVMNFVATDGSKVSDAAVALNIDLLIDGKEQQPKAPIRVTMPIPEGLGDDLVIYHEHNGKVSKIIPIINGDGTFTFFITKLSTFVIDNAEDTDVPDVPSGDYTGSRGGSGGSSNKSIRGAMNYYMSGTWVSVGTQWKFKMANGYFAANQWGYINGFFYYFDANGFMVTGWAHISNEWYYLNPTVDANEGKMVTGWVKDGENWFYTNASGAMVTGWQQINGKWYYLNPVSDGTKGVMVTNQQVGDYYVGADGVWVQ